MSITINRIANGWIIATAIPQQGQFVLHKPSFEEVITELQEMNKQMNAKPEMPAPANVVKTDFSKPD
jgi:hypothetical protein